MRRDSLLPFSVHCIYEWFKLLLWVSCYSSWNLTTEPLPRSIRKAVPLLFWYAVIERISLLIFFHFLIFQFIYFIQLFLNIGVQNTFQNVFLSMLIMLQTKQPLVRKL